MVISFFLGLTTTHSTIAGVGANFVACIIAAVSVRLFTPKRSILLWCALTLLILVGTYLFTRGDSESLIVCGLAGLGIVGAAVTSRHMPILPLPVLHRPYLYNPRFNENYANDEDYFDNEDDLVDEEMPALNDGAESIEGEIEDEEDGLES